MRKISCSLIFIFALSALLLAAPAIAQPSTSYLKEEPSDVVELKRGAKIIGNIYKEGPNFICIRHANGSIEICIPRNTISEIRKPTLAEIKAAEIEAKELEESKILPQTLSDKAGEEKQQQGRYNEELRSAQKIKQKHDLVRARVDEAKSLGQVCMGMTEADVEEVLGPPDHKERRYRGLGKRETWYYNGEPPRKIRFYNGEVTNYY